jgi:hypothetical protein
MPNSMLQRTDPPWRLTHEDGVQTLSAGVCTATRRRSGTPGRCRWNAGDRNNGMHGSGGLPVS